MKKIILHAILFIFILFCSKSFAQNTLASVEGYSPKRNLTFTNPISNTSETRTIGLIYGKVNDPHNGSDICFYSYSIVKAPDNCMPNFDYVDDSTTTALPKVIYIVNNYYPGKNPGAGQLSNLDNETAAIQAVIWHYTNGLNLNSITSTTVKNRALAIYAAAEANGGSSSIPTTMRIVADADPDYFFVETKKDNGAGQSVTGIGLTITQGSLSPTSVNTNTSGISPSVEVFNSNSGKISATASGIQLPKGRLFRHISNQCPKMILACNVLGTLKAYADWGALPVELSSFTSSVNGRDVTLNWSTSSELNNSGFEIEKSRSGSEWERIGFISGSGTSNTGHSYSFTERNNETGRYNYRLKQIDINGNFEYFNLNNFVSIGVPNSFAVSQNYPNPFNPSTKINYDIPADGTVTIKIFDLSGKEVMSVFNQHQSAGFYTANIDAGNLTSGVYFYKLSVEAAGNNFVMTKKMMLVK